MSLLQSLVRKAGGRALRRSPVSPPGSARRFYSSREGWEESVRRLWIWTLCCEFFGCGAMVWIYRDNRNSLVSDWEAMIEKAETGVGRAQGESSKAILHTAAQRKSSLIARRKDLKRQLEEINKELADDDDRN